MVLKVRCGTVFGTHCQHGGKIRPPKQSHNALWQPSQPGLPCNLIVANMDATLLNFAVKAATWAYMVSWGMSVKRTKYKEPSVKRQCMSRQLNVKSLYCLGSLASWWARNEFRKREIIHSGKRQCPLREFFFWNPYSAVKDFDHLGSSVTLTHWRPYRPKPAVQDYTALKIATFSIALTLP